jgi:hypothetical protein
MSVAKKTFKDWTNIYHRKEGLGFLKWTQIGKGTQTGSHWFPLPTKGKSC